ncbi:MAG: Sec-independent protein translocase protein TatB [Bacteroidales bacterium]|jgi:sec-independent protein translocase protein TatB|nr:Sec-independent protein translocase protein TatB [Bacteroidales bacterium]MCK9447463.1 Sec-independent protein translocase protein TatB [Bacteroidales bacterium]MDD3700663.1 Sec-independent protein translocase protein TatB [Bacteroidales bacterium]MDY0368214.1 Sec-independent protein translocase protein TatB [Bacteroidales bacterium]
MLLFFNIGTGELVVILLVLFVVLGPKRLPEVARTLGKTINEMKRASAGFKNEIDKEIQKIERETRMDELLHEKSLTSKTSVDTSVAPVISPPEDSVSMEQPDQPSAGASQEGNENQGENEIISNNTDE